MKQVAQNYRSGELVVLEVPEPACRPGGVLVRSLYSLISTGTEVAKVNEAKLSLLGKARARPDQVKKVLESVAQQGLRTTYSKAMNRLDSLTPLGYSVAGIVIEVGAGADEFRVGQLVACAGNEYALHAEVNWVPVNLCVPVPDGVSPRLAAFATVGAIALHGVRRAEPQLGDTAVVIGLGLIGQVVVRLLTRAGAQVVGLDTVAERCRVAERGGAAVCDTPDPAGLQRLEQALARLTEGIGADQVLLTAGGSAQGPVEAAARLARDRARVVDIGRLDLHLPWNTYYEKELDVRFSRSYGPGRYDDLYEVAGIDYPVGYVRWTERRNLSAFLDLVRSGMPFDELLSDVFPVTEATSVYEGLRGGSLRGIGYLFSYPDLEPIGAQQPARRTVVESTTRPLTTGRDDVRLGFIGAGNYAYLDAAADPEGPSEGDALDCRDLDVALSGERSAPVRLRPGIDRCGRGAVGRVDRRRVHRHPAQLARGARVPGARVRQGRFRGKAARPHRRTARTGRRDGAEHGHHRLMVGFNRRFAPMITQLRAAFGAPAGASMLRYLVERRSARSQELVPQRARGGCRASWGRADTSSTRPAGGWAPSRWRWSPWRRTSIAIYTWCCGTTTVRSPASIT